MNFCLCRPFLDYFGFIWKFLILFPCFTTFQKWWYWSRIVTNFLFNFSDCLKMNIFWIVRVWIWLLTFIANRKQTWNEERNCANTCAKCEYYRQTQKFEKWCVIYECIFFALFVGTISYLEKSISYVIFNILNHRPVRYIISGWKLVDRRQSLWFLYACLRMDFRGFSAHLIDGRVFFTFTIILCFCLRSVSQFWKQIMLK